MKITIDTKPNATKIPIANKEGQLQIRHDGVLFDGELYMWKEIKRVIIENEQITENIKIEIDFSYINLPRERVIEYAFLPSGRIIAMTKYESFWFESDGTSPKGSYLIPCPQK